MTKLALKRDTVLQGHENEIFEQLIVFDIRKKSSN